MSGGGDGYCETGTSEKISEAPVFFASTVLLEALEFGMRPVGCGRQGVAMAAQGRAVAAEPLVLELRKTLEGHAAGVDFSPEVDAILVADCIAIAVATHDEWVAEIGLAIDPHIIFFKLHIHGRHGNLPLCLSPMRAGGGRSCRSVSGEILGLEALVILEDKTVRKGEAEEGPDFCSNARHARGEVELLVIALWGLEEDECL